MIGIMDIVMCQISIEKEEEEEEEEEEGEKEEEERSLVGKSSIESPSLLLTTLFYPSCRPHHLSPAPSPAVQVRVKLFPPHPIASDKSILPSAPRFCHRLDALVR